MNKHFLSTGRLALFVLVFAVGLSSSGCGDKGGPDPKVEAAQLDAAKQIRDLFDKSGHIAFEALGEKDKAMVVTLCNNDASKAKVTWDFMKNGANGGGTIPPVHPPDPNKPNG